MKGIKMKYLIILALVVFDLIALLATFILKYNIIFIKLLLLSITIAIVIPTIWYYLRVVKQPITSKEYYRTIVEEEYQYLDNNLLIKMLEMRIANRRNFILYSPILLFWRPSPWQSRLILKKYGNIHTIFISLCYAY